MKKKLLHCVALCCLILPALSSAAAQKEFSFGVISPPQKAAADETTLRDALEQADSENLAFVVANGIKTADEPCTDKIYNDRKALLHSAKSSLIVSLAAADWAQCTGGHGKPSAIGKLNRLRDLFFTDESSFGDSRIRVIRQSATAKFRSYAENARWEVGNVMFATLNLPSNNNHYVSDAGRNSEFEDRLIANRDWLNRIYTYAIRKKLGGIVLFCDGNPLPPPASEPIQRDGFAETRRYLASLAARFPGKILLIHSPDEPGASPASGITWHGNLGEAASGPSVLKLTVSASSPSLFVVASDPVQASNHHQ